MDAGFWCFQSIPQKLNILLGNFCASFWVKILLWNWNPYSSRYADVYRSDTEKYLLGTLFFVFHFLSPPCQKCWRNGFSPGGLCQKKYQIACQLFGTIDAHQNPGKATELEKKCERYEKEKVNENLNKSQRCRKHWIKKTKEKSVKKVNGNKQREQLRTRKEIMMLLLSVY